MEPHGHGAALKIQVLIRQGRILDPGRLDMVGDIGVAGGKIVMLPGADTKVQYTQKGHVEACRVIDARGRIVTPGLIDMHVHFRQPGQTHKETIASGCRAAARGGFTAVCTMPNTLPPNDNPAATVEIKKLAARANGVRVFPVAAITRGLGGQTLTDFAALRSAGAVALSDDGQPVVSDAVMQKALEAAGALGLLVISHSEEPSLSAGGHMNAGQTARRLGYAGIPNAAEFVMVKRDIALCEVTGAALHIAHVSTAQSVQAIREAKKRGVPVSAETAPHYLMMTDQAVATQGTNAKMNPPLRSAADRSAVIQGLADGTIDAIATDHAPHAPQEKAQAFEQAPNGVIGLETSLGIGLKLVQEGALSLEKLIAAMSVNPGRLLGVDNRLEVGRPADITIIDPDDAWTVKAADFQSLSRNTPFEGWRLPGRAALTIVGGRIVFDAAHTSSLTGKS